MIPYTYRDNSGESGEEIISFYNLKVDLKCRYVVKEQEHIELRRKEFDILVLLSEHPGWVYTKEQIYDAIWKEEFSVDIDNTVTCQIKQLRKKLGNNPKGEPYIENVWGVGYRFNSGMN